MFRKVNKKNFSSYGGILKHCRSHNLSKALLKAVEEIPASNMSVYTDMFEANKNTNDFQIQLKML